MESCTTQSELLPYENLMCACIPFQDAGGVHTTRLIESAEVDWPEFVRQCVRHGIAQHAADYLEPYANRLPQDVWTCLERIRHANGERNAVMFTAASRLLLALAAAEIRVLALKGVALSLTAYDDPGVRPFADIDILVDAENMDAAGRIAEECGFALDGEGAHPLKHHVAYRAQADKDILSATMAAEFDPSITPEILERDSRAIKLEIHQCLVRSVSGLRKETDQSVFWDRPQIVCLPDGTPMATPSIEAGIVHLCEHAAQHRFDRLLFATDLIRIIQLNSNNISWSTVEAIAVQSSTASGVYRMLDLVRREFNAPVPQEIIDTLRVADVDASLAATPTLKHVFRTGNLDIREAIWDQARNSDWRGFLSTTWQIAFPPAPFMRDIYGDHSRLTMAALTLARPLQLTGRLARVLCRRRVRGLHAQLAKGTRSA